MKVSTKCKSCLKMSKISAQLAQVMLVFELAHSQVDDARVWVSVLDVAAHGLATTNALANVEGQIGIILTLQCEALSGPAHKLCQVKCHFLAFAHDPLDP